MEKPRIKSLLQMLLAVILLAAFLVTPVEFAITKTTVARIEHSEWLLEMASVSMDYHPELIADALNRCYVQILHGVLSVFGNSMAVAREFQNVLWMLSVLFVYLTIRRLLSGGWIATLALAAAVVTAWLRPEDIYQLRAGVLLVLAATIVLWLAIFLVTEVWRRCRRFVARKAAESKGETKKMKEVPIEETAIEETAVEEVPAEAMNMTETRQIPNILPEPKKHVRREAVNFAREIPEEQMHFDVENTGDDDFDLK